MGRPGELRGWTGLSPWQVGVVCTPDVLLFLCDTDAEMRARGHCVVTCSRARGRPPGLGGRDPEGPTGRQELVSQGAALGPDEAERDQGLNLSREGRGWAVTEQEESSTPRPWAPEAPE